MTTKHDMISRIESLLGPEGCTELAEAMLPHLEAARLISFDAQDGYYFNERYYADHDNHRWNTALDSAIEQLNA